MRDRYDVVIAGGGPAGSTTGLVLARAGFSVCILEKDAHPRFHIGESILPRNMSIIQELGLEDELRKLPHVPKYGAEFGMGNNLKTRMFNFSDGLLPGSPVFNIERAFLDKMLLDQARVAGAEVFEETPVKEIVKLTEGDVRVKTATREVAGRVLIDASGHGTVVGRHLDIRRNFTEPELQKVAYFQHFEGVERPMGPATGHPCIIMCDEGWFWLIGLSETKTSVGFVTRPSFIKTLNVPVKRLLSWAVQRCPVVRHRMRDAVGPADNIVLSDFSYRCRPYAGDGYFMVGDAACFLDPIFSTGVTLAMVSAKHTGEMVGEMLHGRLSPAAARRRHISFVAGSCRPFWRLIRAYYQHSFRELFMEGQGPFEMQRAIISILAGQVFPEPVWSLRWRHAAFHACVQLQKLFTLVPRREPCRLVDQKPEPVPTFGDLVTA
ncbi:MAG: NAD(P)/FAD-dependent oxidoreductase [Planctomycetota bacterium]